MNRSVSSVCPHCKNRISVKQAGASTAVVTGISLAAFTFGAAVVATVWIATSLSLRGTSPAVATKKADLVARMSRGELISKISFKPVSVAVELIGEPYDRHEYQFDPRRPERETRWQWGGGKLGQVIGDDKAGLTLVISDAGLVIRHFWR